MASLAALIIAKGSSKRLPNKNKLDFNGKPMFQWNVEKCLRIFSRVYVSSDDSYILETAEWIGAIPIKRDQDLCGDVPNIPVYRHALQYMNGVDGIVAVQANSPTISSNLIRISKELLEKGFQEIMTMHEDRTIYGSIWALSRYRLETYKDFYNPNPDVLLYDKSIDIHCWLDYKNAKQCHLRKEIN
jgi:CMP-N-acetylneuraminic acid synthetase